MCCVYEGKNTENELYKQFLTQGCDHFEQLQMIVVSEDCFFRKRMN
jgi:hypothetical protein